MTFKEHLKKQLSYLVRHGLWYWLRVFLLIVLGLYLSDKLDERQLWADVRYSFYQELLSWSPKDPHPDSTAIVLIDDDEYWKGKPAGRSPIKRDYLADILLALDRMNPAVIALDFDLRSPSPDGNPVEQPELQPETQRLLDAVKTVSQHRSVVLPITLHYDDAREDYVTESDIYRGFDFAGGKVLGGYVILSDDRRQVPLLTVHASDGPLVESFSQAVVRAYRSNVLERYRESEELPYGGFIDRSKFNTVSAAKVLRNDPKAAEAIAFKIVLVGANWSTRSYKRGNPVDAFDTPAGLMPGVFLHANYAEALLDGRIYRPWGGWMRLILEAFWSLLVAVPLALDIRPWQKFLSVGLIGVAIVLFSYISLMNLGLFYDFFIPTVLVFAHGTLEQIWEWRAAARKCAREHPKPQAQAAADLGAEQPAPARA